MNSLPMLDNGYAIEPNNKAAITKVTPRKRIATFNTGVCKKCKPRLIGFLCSGITLPRIK
ncbi:hypothetical protein BMETH_1662_0 [methanotrophic bacterial endosymbiont of Bathymodiolus sp.]|nr:hypothetical protein BMETH_1662_0 [methanotrophic bacterial endosymbiont of Bathymodiolus sp.]